MTLLPMAASAISGVALMPLAIRAHRHPHDEFHGPQAIHGRPTSRLGGAIVFVAYTLAVLVILTLDHSPRRAGLVLLFAALPVVGVGLVEDLTHRVAPCVRLAAAFVSAALASVGMGVILPRFGVPGLDSLIAFAPLAALCTWFMVAGLCSAMNIIDGSHGLAAGTGLLMFVGLAVIAVAVDDRFVFAGALAMSGALLGFLVWNYPSGHIFLGDAGAYFLGFMYAELSLLLVIHNPGVSPWFPLALAAYPVTETVYSMYRRRLLSRAASMQPDLMHLHSLVYRRIVANIEPGASMTRVQEANARVAPWMWMHTTICLVVAIPIHRSTGALAAFVACYAACYVIDYRLNLRSDTAQASAIQYCAAGD